MTSQVRARSVDQKNGCLADVLERVVAINLPVRPEQNYKPPQYEGKVNVGYFILHFEEVVEANG